MEFNSGFKGLNKKHPERHSPCQHFIWQSASLFTQKILYDAKQRTAHR